MAAPASTAVNRPIPIVRTITCRRRWRSRLGSFCVCIENLPASVAVLNGQSALPQQRKRVKHASPSTASFHVAAVIPIRGMPDKFPGENPETESHFELLHYISSYLDALIFDLASCSGWVSV